MESIIPLHSGDYRLNDQEKINLAIIFSEIMKDFSAVKIYLYGSRTNPKGRGGDIDLLVCFESPKLTVETFKIRRALIAKCLNLMGERKIDVLIYKKGSEKNAFVSLAIKEGIVIWQKK